MGLDIDRVRTKLGDISRSLQRLQAISEMGREAFLLDEDSQDIARSRLLTAVEAALNICYHVCAKRLQSVPEDYAECFLLQARENLIPSELAERLAAMARFRNRLVHLYWDIDYGQVFEILPDGLRDLEDYSRQVAQWL